MAQQLTGIQVVLTTSPDDGDVAGTDDHLYIGIVGKGGGREFPLDSEEENFEPGTEVFALGSVPGPTSPLWKYPIESKPGELNDPELQNLDLEQVDYVYLRKQGERSPDGDDFYALGSVDVVLYGPANADPSLQFKRHFHFNRKTIKSLWLANPRGHVVYLPAIDDNGVFGTTSDHNKAGVRGENSGGGHGVEGYSVGLAAVHGQNAGIVDSPDPDFAAGIGVFGESVGGAGVYGVGVAGVMGIATDTKRAGIEGYAADRDRNLAGQFHGAVEVKGHLSKLSGSFKIDHPLDPENKYLYHSFIESPDMMNIYNGNVTTDANGEATVTLPDYFEALNRDFRYQLTVVGQFAQAIVARKITHNRFTIRTDKPSVEVSWQVTGVRQDAYANAYRIQVEEEKPVSERGSLLHPGAYGRAPKQVEEGDFPLEVKELLKKHRERLQRSNQ
jgi:hypothetical protein